MWPVYVTFAFISAGNPECAVAVLGFTCSQLQLVEWIGVYTGASFGAAVFIVWKREVNTAAKCETGVHMYRPAASQALGPS